MAERDLSALFSAHRRELEVFLNRQVRCRDTAADLLQETFLRLSEQPSDAPLRNVRAYLYQTARNLVVDHFRREKRRQTQTTPAEQLADVPDGTVPVDRALEARQKLQLLRRAISELPPRTREIFELNRIQGLTYIEVARRLGVSESSVQKHLAKALSHAIQRLKSG